MRRLLPDIPFVRLAPLLALLGLFPMGGCGGIHGAGSETGGERGFFSWLRPAAQPEEKDEATLAREAMDCYARGRYLLAEEMFQKIRDRYPFSPYATLAELRLADCKYHQGLYEEAIPLYEEFEKLHPTNEAVPYVIFQEGSCYYHLMATADRDQSHTEKLIETMERLLKRYPDSPYGLEARRMIAEGRDRLARHELVVARWYVRTGQIPQAKNRLELVLALYPGTDAGVEADRLLDRIASLGSGTPLDEQTSGGASWWRRALPFL